MKLDNKLVCHFSLAILCVSLTGCGTIPSYEDLGNRYVEATYTSTGLWEPSGHRFALCYKHSDFWHSTIWPDTLGIIATNGIAIFSAFVADDPPPPDWPRATHSRLFAVKAPELPLDITDEVLWRWSKQSGEDFAKILRTASIANWEQKNGAVEFLFATGTHKDIIMRLDWNQISDVMREVKEKGVVRKDRVQGTRYIEIVFKPEVQK
ncbi:MAG: hypothetical protein ABSH11_02975 [Verrucomicrobiota bacterium]|jgi:hypothetical protein